ncbi:MAG: UDP-glycosyltransferase [Flavobacteriaceae bacterium]|nr:UDP-glycosyltransferase [Flavobacteriaceae bacterium]MDZ4148172.1 UDP-glycosyltransferase [Flavobacteriaceae bacterium]
MKSKLFLLLPDGIGLRNFAFTRFPEIGKQMGFDTVFWNQTDFPVRDALGFEELKITDAKLHPLTTVFSRARKRIELKLWENQFQDTIYQTYNFPQSYRGFKNAFKSLLVDYLTATKTHPKGLEKVIRQIKKYERNTTKYTLCKQQLEAHRPAFVFCTNQRPTQAVAPILAAQDLGIPTATFIFSWDNLPKATMVLDTDFYFVWSDYMKTELQRYYPRIKDTQILVTGTPQFEPHFDETLIESRAAFCEKHGLDPAKKYICFSGDDVTTSPDDPQYLEDTAKAVRELNGSGQHLGLIFRPCPVDFSGRYDAVVEQYADIIKPIAPAWKPLGEAWNQAFPTREDMALLANTARHSELVLNLGSSMVFDFAVHQKPCGYFCYNQANRSNKHWSIYKCYQYVHFRSMPTKETVLWINQPSEIGQIIKQAISLPKTTVGETENWFKVINLHPPEKSSERIWEVILKITSCTSDS